MSKYKFSGKVKIFGGRAFIEIPRRIFTFEGLEDKDEISVEINKVEKK